MDITCGRCRRSYFVPDDLVQGRTFRAKCSQCGHAFAVDVPAARRGTERRGAAGAPAEGAADSLPSTAASAIPDFADALADADLGWLDEAAATADARDDQVFLLTVQRSRRGSAVAIAAGVAVAVAAVAGLAVWMKTRAGLPEGGGARAARADGPAPLAVQDAGGLVARPEPAGDDAAAAPAPPPGPPPVSRLRTKRLSSTDRRLLDLLARKEDAKPVGPQEEEAVESERSALDPAAAEKVIAANRRAFDACVSKALRLNPDLKLVRRATMVLTVQPDGKVSEASLVEERIARSDLGVCLGEAARRMVFPGFEGDPIEIAMPLSLSAAY